MGEPIAIVGLGCVLPDASTPTAFWANTLNGHSAIRPLRGGGWNWARYCDGNGPDASISMLGARVENHVFDWRRFKMPPSDAQAINPLQLMVLDAGTQALEHVKVLPRETSGLFLGATGLGWQRDSGLRIRTPSMLDALEASPAFASLPPSTRDAVRAAAVAGLDQRLKPVTEDNVVGASASVAAGRIAMHFDLKGLHYSVDAGFASSLAALDVGVRALRDGTVDLAVVGGVSELLTPLELVAFSRLGGLARQRVAPFDAQAEGTLLGEGVVILALKRLPDAIRDGEHIHAVVLGVGGSSDGYGKALVAPDPEGQAQAMRRAYEDAGVSPSSVGLVECHATGTQVGDVSEVRALTTVYGRGAPGTVALGSAKPFVGHLRAASGAVGLLRAVLALENRTAPAQIGFSTPNPAMELEATPFTVPTSARPLDVLGGADLPRASVSAFGFGGINYHAVLEAHAPGRPTTTRPRPPKPEPIAIVGMGAVLPGARSVPEFWNLLQAGVDTTREVPQERWDINRHHSTDPNDSDRSYSRLGCFVDGFPSLQPRWKIPPSAVPGLDPSQLLVLEAAEEALRDAGFNPGKWPGDRVGAVLGFLPYQGKKFLADIRINFTEFALELEEALRNAGIAPSVSSEIITQAANGFRAALPPITEDTLTGYLGSINAGRLTKLYDFHGPHFVVDSACASTHAALHAAIQALQHRTCDVMLSGGVWADMMPEFFIAACRFNALSATGIKPFCASADGFIPGEGAGIFVLKRLTDAERDGDRVHAVIRAVAGSSDGRGRSVLAPNPAGEAMAMQRALAAAGIHPAQVEYVECHGTGTALGDVVEVDAMTRAYGTARPTPLRIGSAKSNVGHLNAAAGVPGLIKATLAVRDGILPPSLKARELNPQIDFTSGPVHVVQELQRWDAPLGQPRRAGVSGFGVGGTNLHMVVEQYLGRPVQSDLAGDETLPIAVARGGNLKACVASMDALVALVSAAPPADQARLLKASHQSPPGGADSVRVALVASDLTQLQRRYRGLAAAVERGSDLGALKQQGILVGSVDPSIQLAAVFPGQGPQYPNMLRAAAEAFPSLSRMLARADAAYHALCGRALTPSFLVDPAVEYQQPDEDIHCAVFVVNCALFQLLTEHGVRPHAVLGQSAGELSALVAAGVLSFEDGLRAVRERTLAVMGLKLDDPGRMVALTCSAEQAATLMDGLPGYAAIAADNAPSACIVSGATAAMAVLQERCAASGIDATPLAVSHAYHSQIIAPARERYLSTLRTLTFNPPQCEIFSTITGESITRLAPSDFPELLASQFVRPVALRQAVLGLHTQGVRMFVECGPKWGLTTFIDEILGDRPHAAQATLHPKVGEVEQLRRALGFLHVHGASELAPVGTPPPAAPPVAPPAMDLSGLLSSLRGVIDGFLRPLEAREGPGSAAAVQVQALSQALEAAARSMPPGAAARLPAPPPPLPINGHAVASNGTEKDVLALLVGLVVRKTGYPADMLEPDLDLEADLGIDTVKQVAILGEARGALKLPPDPSFRLRECNTLRKAAQYFSARSAGAPVTATPPRMNGVHAPAAQQVNGSSTNVDEKRLQDMLLAQVVRRTGYPPDMLELDLDLEADLGIDTVKQVAILGEFRSALGLQPDATFKLRDHNTLRKVLGHFASRMAAAGKHVTPAAISSVQPTPVAKGANAAGPAPTTGTAVERVHPLLRANFLRKTGYPAEMFEDDADLEADLGIDTVKQIAVVAETRAQLGLPADPSFKLRGHNTLRKLAEYLAGRLASVNGEVALAGPPTLEPAAAPTPPVDENDEARVRSTVLSVLLRKTGYPEEMVEPDLDLEADLGIDTVKQVAILGEARGQLGLPADPAFKLRDHTTLGKVIHYFARQLRDRRPVVTTTPVAAPAVEDDPWRPAGEPRYFTPRSAGTALVCGGAELRAVTVACCTELILSAACREGPDGAVPSLSRLKVVTPPLVEETGSLQVVTQLGRPSGTTMPGRLVSPGGAVHLELQVDWTNAAADVPARRFQRGPLEPQGAANGAALLEAMGRGGAADPASVIRWAQLARFDTLIAGVSGPRPTEAPIAAAQLAWFLDVAFVCAAFGWHAHTGAFHTLSQVDRIRMLQPVEPAADLAVEIKLGARTGGLWRADALLLRRATGEIVAVADGLRGRAVAGAAGSVLEDLPLDGVVQGWQRFRRLLTGSSDGGEAT